MCPGAAPDSKPSPSLDLGGACPRCARRGRGSGCARLWSSGPSRWLGKVCRSVGARARSRLAAGTMCFPCSHPFGVKLLALCKEETRKSKDVQKLRSGIAV